MLGGAIVIPYGASMPYIREGVPGPGLFPMMIGGLLILFGAPLPLTTWLSERRMRAEGSTSAPAGGEIAPAEADPFALSGAAAPDSDGDVPLEELETAGVMDTDVGSDGARRWINGAILMGGIVAYVLARPGAGLPDHDGAAGHRHRALPASLVAHGRSHRRHRRAGAVGPLRAGARWCDSPTA
ncbi:hypothetical protein [Brachybacterium sp. GPGPB12]|uniref:hypothetical protein n=1 Tax=Brachybacterium sp. GPGPB12 TaxID=3023517 RepID=UPI0031343291